jgi:3-oxoacyl-[acyl-carrier-protein] synthase I
MKLLPHLLSDTVSGTNYPAWSPLKVLARGMCCAVGHNAEAATIAINARMNHFRETEFVDAGLPIMGATLYGVDIWGAERLQLMAQSVMTQCLAALSDVNLKDIAVLLLSAEPGRPGMPREHLGSTLHNFAGQEDHLDHPFHAESCLVAYGKGGIAAAVADASALLNSATGPEYVLMVAVDSLLDAAAIENYLIQMRLNSRDNTDGFIPGEGAAAVILSKKSHGASGLWIDGVGIAHDDWRIDGDAALRANGLTTAIRAAAQMAGTEVADMDFHASGMTGEGWYAKETNLALSRCMERKKKEFPQMIIASNVGETGAASPLLTLAWLAGAMEAQSHQLGSKALLHFAGDYGKRSALVVRYRSSGNSAL